MKKIPIDLIKKLRAKTGVSIIECKKALEKSNGDLQKAEEILAKKGALVAAKKSQRETADGLVEAYIHQDKRSGVLVEVLCETDFVARNPEFKKFSHEIAMQICAMKPRNVKELMKQEYIRDPGITIEDLKNQLVAKVGENVRIGRFTRYSL